MNLNTLNQLITLTFIIFCGPACVAYLAYKKALQLKREKNTLKENRFDLTLTEVPADKKIPILKIVRSVTGLGLKESKEIVDNVPKLLKEGLSKEESENLKKELEAAGAKISIQ